MNSRMWRALAAGAAAVIAAAGGVVVAVTPVTAAAAPAAVSPCPVTTGAEWNARNPRQPAADLGPILPGVNAGPLGTDVACLPVPPLDRASTDKLWAERGPAMLEASKLKAMPSADNASIKPRAGTAGKSAPGAKRFTTCSPSTCHFYAAGAQSGIAGVTSHTWTQRVAKPGLGSDGLPNGFTLAEGTVAGPAAAGGTNYAEIGTTVSAAVCGSTGFSPCIFVFNWTPGAGCYNGCGWTNVAGCNPCMGTSVTSWVGTSKIFSLSHLTSPGRWCASANNQYVACVNDTDWTSSEFVPTGAGQTNHVDEFFEVGVGSNTLTTAPNTDMGDNQLANCSTPAGSYFINGNVNGTTVNLSVFNSATNGGAVDVTKYDVCLMPARTDYFRGGGPGY